MKEQEKEAGRTAKTYEGKEDSEKDVGTYGKEECRCKEVSRKSFPELLKVMIGDLAFWNRKK